MAVTEKVLIDACKEFIADFLDAYHKDNDQVVYRMKDTLHPSRQESTQKKPTDDNDNDHGIPSTPPTSKIAPPTSTDKGGTTSVNCNGVCGTTAGAPVGCYAHRFGADGSGRSRRLCLLTPVVRTTIRDRFNRYRHRHHYQRDIVDEKGGSVDVRDSAPHPAPCPHRSGPFQHFVPPSPPTSATTDDNDTDEAITDNNNDHRQKHQERDHQRPAWVLPIGYYDDAIDRFVYAVRCPAHFIADFAMRVVLLPYLLEQWEEPSPLKSLDTDEGSGGSFTLWVKLLKARLRELHEGHVAGPENSTASTDSVSVDSVLVVVRADCSMGAFRRGQEWCGRKLLPALKSAGNSEFKRVTIKNRAYVIRSEYERRSNERGDDWPQLANIVVSGVGDVGLSISKKPDRLYCLDRGHTFGWHDAARLVGCWDSRETAAFVQWLSGVSKWSPLPQSVPKLLWTALVVAFGASSQHCPDLASKVGMPHRLSARNNERDTTVQLEHFCSIAKTPATLMALAGGTKVVTCGDATMSFSDLHLDQTGTSVAATTACSTASTISNTATTTTAINAPQSPQSLAQTSDQPQAILQPLSGDDIPHGTGSDNDSPRDCEDDADSAGQACSITCSLPMSQEATPIASPALGPTAVGGSLRGCADGMGSADEPKHTIAHIPLQANSHIHNQQPPEPVLLTQPQHHTGSYAERPPVTDPSPPSSQEEAPAAHPQTTSQTDPGPNAAAVCTGRKRSDRSASFASECQTSRSGPRIEDSKRTNLSMSTAITESPAPHTINLVSSGAAGGHRRRVPSPLRRLPTVTAVAGAGTFEFYSDGLLSRVHTDQQPWALLSTSSVQAQGADILVYGFVRTTEAVGLSWWIPHDLGPIHLADSEASADTSFILRIPPASTLAAGQQYAVCLGTSPASRSDVLGEISFTIQDPQTASENYHGPEATPHGAATGTCRNRGDRNASRSGQRSEGSADALPPQPEPPAADPSATGTVTASNVVHTAAVEAEESPLRRNEIVVKGRRYVLVLGRVMWGYYWPGWYRYVPVNPDGSLDLDTPSLDEATVNSGPATAQEPPVMPPTDAAPTAVPPAPPAPEAPRGQFPTHFEIQMAVARAQRRRGWAV